jgi:hypothetical protein
MCDWNRKGTSCPAAESSAVEIRFRQCSSLAGAADYNHQRCGRQAASDFPQRLRSF